MKVEREEKEVVVILDNLRIEGKAHIPPGGRISDFFNVPKKSLVLTEAKVFLHENSHLLYSIEFIVLNRDLIRGIFNKDALEK